jgi:DNA (cytosine-5)-methyltransferase 1
MGLDAAGFEPIAHAEIEPNARAVLRRQWPTVPLHGDVTQIDGTQFRGVTLISGGSPCQDLSVAGRRAGLDGARSGLFHEQVRIWKESEAPYLIWENVLGALSSNNGHDFAAVLSAIVGADVAVPAHGWKRGGVASGRDAVAAWRVLDLQHFGPPQRRVRVFLVAARAGGVDPAEVLALGESQCGHPSPREQAEEAARRELAGRAGASTIDTRIKWASDCPPCPLCEEPWCVDCDEHYADCACLGPNSLDEDDAAHRCDDLLVARMVAFGEYTIDGTASAIKARDYKDATDLVYSASMNPRRLTPLECERLMSWPDHWTRYGAHEDGTPFLLSDAARYRLCGNGVGSVCVAWFAARLAGMIEAASCPP